MRLAGSTNLSKFKYLKNRKSCNWWLNQPVKIQIETHASIWLNQPVKIQIFKNRKSCNQLAQPTCQNSNRNSCKQLTQPTCPNSNIKKRESSANKWLNQPVKIQIFESGNSCKQLAQPWSGQSLNHAYNWLN